eukprot:5495527-Ditylum_brightwellii.AAC.1
MIPADYTRELGHHFIPPVNPPLNPLSPLSFSWINSAMGSSEDTTSTGRYGSGTTKQTKPSRSNYSVCMTTYTHLILGYVNVTTLQLINHFNTTWSLATTTQLEVAEEKMKTPLDSA